MCVCVYVRTYTQEIDRIKCEEYGEKCFMENEVQILLYRVIDARKDAFCVNLFKIDKSLKYIYTERYTDFFHVFSVTI